MEKTAAVKKVHHVFLLFENVSASKAIDKVLVRYNSLRGLGSTL